MLRLRARSCVMAGLAVILFTLMHSPRGAEAFERRRLLSDEQGAEAVERDVDLGDQAGADNPLAQLAQRLDDLTATHHEAQERIDSLTDQNAALTRELADFFAAAEKNEENKGWKPSLRIQATGGVTYVRWGRTGCDNDDYTMDEPGTKGTNNASVIYSGYAGSNKVSESGGGAEMLCLHADPEWDRGVLGVQNLATIYGVQYTSLDALLNGKNNNFMPFNLNNMPCALCQVDKRSAQVMIPGRKNCPPGWIMEYWGFIVSTHRTSYKGSFKCLDNASGCAQHRN